MNKIKEKRIELGLTQRQLSELTGIPLRSIENWEGGQRKCPEYVEKLLLESLKKQEDVYLIFRDSMDDCCEIIGYIRGSEKEAENYCDVYNANLKQWERQAEYMLVERIK